METSISERTAGGTGKRRSRVAATNPLRVGIMVDDLVLETWQRQVVLDIAASSFAELAAVVVCWAPADRKSSWLTNLRRMRLHRTGELYDLYEALGVRFLGGKISYRQRHDIRPLIDGAALVNVVPQRERELYDTIADDDLERLRELRLDVLVRFGFRILRGGILDLPTWGVWSFHHGDETRYRGGPSCFWEMAAGEPTIGCILQVLNDRLDGGRVIYKSYSSCRQSLWVPAVREQHYLKSSAFVRRCLAAVHNTRALPPVPEGSGAPLGSLYRKPGNVRAAWEIGRLGLRSVFHSAANMFRSGHWSIAVRRIDGTSPPPTSLSGYRRIAWSPKSWDLADPNLITVDGVTYCFVERSRPGSATGHIACFRFDDNGHPTDAKTAIECEHHLSYPFTFEWEGAVHMLVEAAEARCIKVFRAEAFPLRWIEVARMLDGMRVFDPTLLEHDGRWYLFSVIDECGGGSADELFLFVGDTPLGPWSPHPMNPVVSDVRVARPAGAVLRDGPRLLRPAQDCSKMYGRAINLCEITELSPTRFAQQIVGRLGPEPRSGIVGCHTLARSGRFEVVDRRSYRLNFPFPRPLHAG